MGPEKIANEETLAAWLHSLPCGTAAEIADTRRKAVWIAHRAALRLLKYALRTNAGLDSASREAQALVVLRASLLSDVAARDPDPAIVATASRCPLPIDPGTQVGADAILIEAPKIATSLALSAAASSGPDLLNSAISATNNAAQVLTYIAEEDAVGTGIFVDREADFWEIVNWERGILEKNGDTEKEKLWGPADLFDGEWLRDRGLTSPIEVFGPFWSRWHEGILTANQINLCLLKEIALMPSEDWGKGADHVNALIAGIRERRALLLSDNAERIEINPETGLLRIVPESDLPADIGEYARRKMARAIRIFGDAPANQYTPLEPALRVVRDALDDASYLPMELYDACASSSRLVTRLALNEVIPGPEQDALIHEYLRRIREAAADILGSDPKARDVLQRRNVIAGNDALIKVRENVIAVADQLTALSEGYLAKALPLDAATATDTRADREERKVSSFRLAGRYVRIGVAGAFVIAGAYGAASIGVKEFARDFEAVRSSPQFEQVWRAVLDHLGL